jgi:hypothetical protein
MVSRIALAGPSLKEGRRTPLRFAVPCVFGKRGIKSPPFPTKTREKGPQEIWGPVDTTLPEEELFGGARPAHLASPDRPRGHSEFSCSERTFAPSPFPRETKDPRKPSSGGYETPFRGPKLPLGGLLTRTSARQPVAIDLRRKSAPLSLPQKR